MHKAQHSVDLLSSRNFGSITYRLYQLLSLMGFMLLLLVSNSTLAEKPNSGVATCPAGTEQYALTDNDYTQLGSTQIASNPSNTPYLLDNNKVAISINLTEIGTANSSEPTKLRKEDSYISVVKYPTGSNATPSFTDINLNFWQPNTNGTQSLAVKQVGVTIFDLDAGNSWSDLVTVTGVTSSGNTIEGAYYPVSPTDVQQLPTGNSVATNGGFTIYPKTRNCSNNDATCQASVVFNQAVTSVKVKFGNTQNITSQARSSIRIKLDSLCVKPSPKLTVIKTLDGERIKKEDQFRVSISDGSSTISRFTTDGKKNEIKDNSGTSDVIDIVAGSTYTISEQVFKKGKTDDKNLEEIIDYNATYECTNTTTGSTTITSSGSLNYNAADKSRSFTLSDITFNDNITCTITNSTTIAYAFSGTVFNDNGGLNLTANEVGAVNSTYFNGNFDRSVESGISDTSVQIRLTDCSNTIYDTSSINAQGSYSFSFPKSFFNVGQTVCIVENEPNGWDYSVDTTTDKREVTITTGNYAYDNLDFGEVKANNAALVLEKEQAANDCKFTDFASLTYSKNPLSSSTTGAGTDIKPGQCIAYKITATNRSNVAIHNFVMQDVLQRKAPNNPADPTVTSVLASPTRTTGVFNDGLINGQNGTITTISATLPKKEKRIFYFNTQYGSTQSE